MKDVGNSSAAASDTTVPSGLRTPAIDISRTEIKASVLDGRGRMLTKWRRIATPQPCLPKILL